MFAQFILIPVMLIFSIMFLYRYSGRRDFLHFDFVQFIYAFIVFPAGYIWLKNFLYILVRQELGVSLSIGQWVVIDSIFSLFFIYFYAFGIIHSLTKSFNLQLKKDPLLDLVERSEYFHEIYSHIGMYVGAFIVVTVLALGNIAFPTTLVLSKLVFYGVITFALGVGFLVYIGSFIFTKMNDIVHQRLYLRIMKVTIAASFLVLLFAYILFTPPFTAVHIAYWFMVFINFGTIVSMFIINPSSRIWAYFEGWKKDELIEVATSANK